MVWPSRSISSDSQIASVERVLREPSPAFRCLLPVCHGPSLASRAAQGANKRDALPPSDQRCLRLSHPWSVPERNGPILSMASVAAASRARHTITLACAPYGAERNKSESTLLREEPGPRAIAPSRQAGKQTHRAVDGFRTGPADPVQPSLIQRERERERERAQNTGKGGIAYQSPRKRTHAAGRWRGQGAFGRWRGSSSGTMAGRVGTGPRYRAMYIVVLCRLCRVRMSPCFKYVCVCARVRVLSSQPGACVPLLLCCAGCCSLLADR